MIHLEQIHGGVLWPSLFLILWPISPLIFGSCRPYIFDRGENEFEKYFSDAKNSVLDFDVFCSRSVLVLNFKILLCSCSVLVREQEQVREHVLEQLACSFIPGVQHAVLTNRNRTFG